MNHEIIQYQPSQALTASDMRAHVNRVQEVMKAVMQGPSKENPAGVHYGTIPGTPKPTLYKAGAEVLAATFRIAVSYHVEELSTADIVRYRVTATGTHQTSGIVMGAGMGECSSGEEKYKWRKASGQKEFDAADAERRRVKYGKDWTTMQVRTEAADLANTVLKMACKRAQVAMILNVTAASDIFTQDIEDLPEELQPRDDAPARSEKKSEGLPQYADANFVKNFPAWTKLINSRKKTAEQIITTVSSKAVLSNDQRAQILAVKKAEAVAFQAVADKLIAADDLAGLLNAAELIGSVASEKERLELTAIVNDRKEEFAGVTE